MRRRFLIVPVAAALVGVSLPSVLPETGSPLVVGIWPQSYTQFLEIESASWVSLPYYRGRQRDGQFDSLLVPPDAAAAAAAGYSIGMNIQPKTGSGQNRTGIAYTDITAQLRAGSGPYYDTLAFDLPPASQPKTKVFTLNIIAPTTAEGVSYRCEVVVRYAGRWTARDTVVAKMTTY